MLPFSCTIRVPLLHFIAISRCQKFFPQHLFLPRPRHRHSQTSPAQCPVPSLRNLPHKYHQIPRILSYVQGEFSKASELMVFLTNWHFLGKRTILDFGEHFNFLDKDLLENFIFILLSGKIVIHWTFFSTMHCVGYMVKDIKLSKHWQKARSYF